MLAKVTNFLKEVTVELKKVSWPTRNELIGSTLIVIISIAILATYIGFCDFIFSKAIHLIIK